MQDETTQQGTDNKAFSNGRKHDVQQPESHE